MFVDYIVIFKSTSHASAPLNLKLFLREGEYYHHTHFSEKSEFSGVLLTCLWSHDHTLAEPELELLFSDSSSQRFSTPRDWITTHTWSEWAVPTPSPDLFSFLGTGRLHFQPPHSGSHMTGSGMSGSNACYSRLKQEGLFCEWVSCLSHPQLTWFRRGTHVGVWWGHTKEASWIPRVAALENHPDLCRELWVSEQSSFVLSDWGFGGAFVTAA